MVTNWRKTLFFCSLLAGVFLLHGCREDPRASAPLPNSVYVWQQHWTPQVSESVRRLASTPAPIRQLVVLGAQVSWKNKKPVVFRPAVDWNALRESGKAVGVGIRIDPMPGAPTPEALDCFQQLCRELPAEAAKQGVDCEEIQIDYDSSQKRLAEYRKWLPLLREAARPLRFTITALPAWLGEPEFNKLVCEADRFVLQVHSVQTRDPGEAPAVFESGRARRWIRRAAACGRPFAVSLPTYSGLVGYSPDGRQLGMALDGIQPRWPKGTRVLNFESDAAQIAPFATQLQQHHAPHLEQICWFRLPLGARERNWSWPTFSAVLEGRVPQSRLIAKGEGDLLVDVKLLNEGEADAPLEVVVVLHRGGGGSVDCEALPGWNVLSAMGEVRWTRDAGKLLSLAPSTSRAIGWVRFNEKQPYTLEVVTQPSAPSARLPH